MCMLTDASEQSTVDGLMALHLLPGYCWRFINFALDYIGQWLRGSSVIFICPTDLSWIQNHCLNCQRGASCQDALCMIPLCCHLAENRRLCRVLPRWQCITSDVRALTCEAGDPLEPTRCWLTFQRIIKGFWQYLCSSPSKNGCSICAIYSSSVHTRSLLKWPVYFWQFKERVDLRNEKSHDFLRMVYYCDVCYPMYACFPIKSDHTLMRSNDT